MCFSAYVHTGVPNTNEMNIFDRFMIDFAVREHAMYFDITTESYFRAFTPAHYVDIDMSLHDTAQVRKFSLLLFLYAYR